MKKLTVKLYNSNAEVLGPNGMISIPYSADDLRLYLPGGEGEFLTRNEAQEALDADLLETLSDAADTLGINPRNKDDLDELLTAARAIHVYAGVPVDNAWAARTAEAVEIIGSGLYDAAVALMDDDLREELHSSLAPCDDLDFLTAYLARHEAKYGEPFTVN